MKIVPSLFLLLFSSLLMPVGTASEMPVWAEGEHANFYMVKYTPGKKWNHGVDYWGQKGIDGHKAHLDALYDSDTLLLGGPLVDEPGAMIVIRARSLLHATSVALRDPIVAHQVLDIDVGGWRWEMSKMRHEYHQSGVKVNPGQPYHLDRIEPDVDVKIKD